eukprot:233171_1
MADDYIQVTTQVELHEPVTGDSKQQEEIKSNNSMVGRYQSLKTVGSDSNELHILIVTIKRADIAPFCDNALSGNCDAYAQITFNNDESTTVRTGTRFRTVGSPKWNYIKRWVFKSKDDIPKQIKFTVYDYDFFGDADLIGEHIFKVEEQGLTQSNNEKHENESASLGDNGSIHFRVNYYCSTIAELKRSMRERRTKCMSKMEDKNKKLNQFSIKWIDDNKDLFLMLKQNKREAKLVSEMDFGDMAFPPYQLIRDEYEMFLDEYRKLQRYYEIDSNGDGYQAYYDKELDVLYYDTLKAANFGGENITNQILVMWRYVFLKNVLLKGQDSEFNIYRSYYFDEKPQKIPMALLALTIQIVLTIAITINVYRNFKSSFIDGEIDIFLIVASVLVFCYISFSTNGTAKLFVRFYKDIDLVYNIPWFLLFCDFISNIVIAIYICLVSLLFLLESSSYAELVLN